MFPFFGTDTPLLEPIVNHFLFKELGKWKIHKCGKEKKV